MCSVKQPPGFVDSTQPDAVCLLDKSLYGLKQAPRAWYTRFAAYVIKLGFRPARSDSSLFILQNRSQTTYLLLYVDAIMLTGSSDALLKALVWFWIIDETLVLTSMLSVCRLNEVDTYQVMEQVMIMVMMVMTTR